MTDFLLLEQLHRMIKEIPRPRLMFNKGISVKGFFRPYMSFSDYTKSSIFGNIDEITPVDVRFSSMMGDRGTADTLRNIKNMSVKFRGKDGNHDMICSSLPVSFINDKDKLLDMFNIFHIRRYFDGINKKAFWRFVIENPEALNCAVHLFSYEGISDSFIYIKWYSVYNAVWCNKNGDRWLVRYKWMPVYEDGRSCGTQKKICNRNYAEFAAGFEPDIALNELETRIRKKNYPALELYVQTLSIKGCIEPSLLDGTLMWDERKAPYMSAGMMILDEIHLENDFENTVSFAPGSDTEGISLYRTELADIMDYMCRIEEVERGAGI